MFKVLSGGRLKDMSLMCDRCYNKMNFLEAFKFNGFSDFDFCKICYEGLITNPEEIDKFKSQDTHSNDLPEFVSTCLATRKYINMGLSL